MKFALCFPDLYDIGMSNLGLKILYKIINDIPYASAERAFSPWIDLQEYLKREAVPLMSIETNTPLNKFDAVGFTLQYELSYPTVLNMLSMANIPIKAAERDNSHPVVIAGGPCTVNPAPVAEFFDAFAIGDAEDSIKEITEAIYLYKSGGDGKRESLLKALSEIEGVYVPAYSTKPVKRRYILNLNDSPYPCAFPVPFTEVVHDRINIEIARGCSCSCRFCQAGMIYRPVRERDPETIIKLAAESIAATGYDEVSFTSLNSGDYSNLTYLLKLFNRKFKDKNISFSLPSLRVSSVTEEVIKEIKVVKKSGFTIAPEAATSRLRLVINKDFEQEDFERTLYSIFKEGWLNLKMYFLIGIPTETDADVEAIPEMANLALKVAKKHTGRFVNVSVGVSPFVPKAHTPFQWCGQIPMDEIIRKKEYLKRTMSRKGLKFKGHDEKMSLLEAVIARGDESVSALVEAAWRFGARLDAWTEVFDFNNWLNGAEKTGLDLNSLAEKTLEPGLPIPWNMIDTQIKDDFLYKEYEKALSTGKTQDCKVTCHACGVKCKSGQYLSEVREDEISERSTDTFKTRYSPVKVRVIFSKTGNMKYLSHLELLTTILKALRRAQVPLVYSKGFNPSPNVAFSPALGVGISGEREFFDMEVHPPFNLNSYKQILAAHMPLPVVDMFFIPLNTPSLCKFITAYKYEILNCGVSAQEIESRINSEENKWILPVLVKFDIIDGRLEVLLKETEQTTVKLSACVKALTGKELEDTEVSRKNMYGWQNEWVEPSITEVQLRK
ncbi:MAG: TIGR03936 family radical SAM-associated protein [Nitrospirae bacterium YQR-1]